MKRRCQTYNLDPKIKFKLKIKIENIFKNQTLSQILNFNWCFISGGDQNNGGGDSGRDVFPMCSFRCHLVNVITQLGSLVQK